MDSDLSGMALGVERSVYLHSPLLLEVPGGLSLIGLLNGNTSSLVLF